MAKIRMDVKCANCGRTIKLLADSLPMHFLFFCSDECKQAVAKTMPCTSTAGYRVDVDKYLVGRHPK